MLIFIYFGCLCYNNMNCYECLTTYIKFSESKQFTIIEIFH